MTSKRVEPLEIDPKIFRKMGYQLIDEIASHLETIREVRVTAAESPEHIKNILGDHPLPEHGQPAIQILEKASELMFSHSLFNGHPRFLGYITSSPAPIGALADLLAAAVNPNVGANILSPLATEVEKQTIRWLAEFIGLPANYGGILVSGGNMANFTAFLAARKAISSDNFQKEGLSGEPGRMTVYCSKATHTWIEKAATLFGHGSESIRWVPADHKNMMNIKALGDMIHHDLEEGFKPFMVVGNAGDVSTGAIDHFPGISGICKAHGLWFHIDGAYGIPAAVLPDLKQVFEGIEQADSIALDPHKWLYSPLEVGCTLIRDPGLLTDTFSSHPEYYNFGKDREDQSVNYYEYGLQNSRGFRALKVWLGLQQVGKGGYVRMIAEDIRLSKLLYELAGNHPQLEAVTQSLSITTFRFIPLENSSGTGLDHEYLNQLNEELVNSLQAGGELFVSNAVVRGKYCLRACIVNFRTSEQDILEIVDIVVREGAKVHRRLQEGSVG